MSKISEFPLTLCIGGMAYTQRPARGLDPAANVKLPVGVVFSDLTRLLMTGGTYDTVKPRSRRVLAGVSSLTTHLSCRAKIERGLGKAFGLLHALSH